MTILNMVGGGANGPKVPLSAISVIAAVGGDTEATITWTDPSDIVVNGVTVTTWSSTKLVRKVGSAPANINDGTLVLTETTRNTYSSTGYTDTGLTNGTTYYYAAFAIADNGLVTISSTTPNVTPEHEGWEPGANTLLYFPLTSDAVDTVHNVSLTSSGTTNYTSVGGVQSAAFTGTNWLSNTNVGYVPQGDVAKTTSFWMYTQGTNQNWTGIVQVGGDGQGENFGAGFYTGGTTNLLMSRGWSTSSTYTITTNSWKYVAVTYSNSTWKMYVNGVLQVTWSSTTAPTSGNNVYLGQNVGDSSERSCFIGHLSNVILENKERTATEVADYYNQTKGDYGL